MTMEREAECQTEVGARRHFAFVIQPPRDLSSAIECRNEMARQTIGGCPPPLSPPHVTLLYMPCSLLDRRRLCRAVTAVRATVPFSLRYAGIHVSSYGTVQLLVQPRSWLQRLHGALVSAMGLDDLAQMAAHRRLELFGTANLGDGYSSHITLGQFGTQAEDAAQYFATLPETEQVLSDLWVADATGPLDLRLAIKLQGSAGR
jgi:2'-5' RNA ligase